MRIVLDTNVVVSGIHWPGPSENVLRAWFLEKFELVSSVPIVDEFVAVMEKFEIPMDPYDILWWKSLIVQKSIVVEPKVNVNVVTRDPKDNKFFDSALEGKADYIISLDKDLLDVGAYGGIKIITPFRFLAILSQS
ncbi:putative toxin-antitoxin system toxin component, PIN family [Candidatus Woesearchaeota archaeon]|nr:putative toxin-antitoxin system toxin component, PIN family [Candidatus Woesearchaeota archaeon]